MPNGHKTDDRRNSNRSHATKPIASRANPEEESTSERGVKQNAPVASRTSLEKRGQALVPPGELPSVANAQEFIRLEKQAVALGVFTALVKKGAKDRRIDRKVVRFLYRDDSGAVTEATVEIAAKAGGQLPHTADLDKYMILMEIAEAQRLRQGELRNPVVFSSADLLRRVGLNAHAAENKTEIRDFFKRMSGVHIESSRGLYHHARKRWLQRTASLFSQTLSQGEEDEDGNVAELNAVWFSEWQLENLNAYHQIPINRTRYFELTRSIAKALYPHLQIWLYASQGSGQFVKDYADIANLIGIATMPNLSRIRTQMRPALDELVRVGMLAAWRIEAARTPKAKKHGYNVVFVAGDGYRRDRETLQQRRDYALVPVVEELPSAPAPELLPPAPQDTEVLVGALVERGLPGTVAVEYLGAISPERYPDVRRMVALHDYKAARAHLRNAVGWLRTALKRIADGQPAYALPPELEAGSDWDATTSASASDRFGEFDLELAAELRREQEMAARIATYLESLDDAGRQELEAEAAAFARKRQTKPDSAISAEAIRAYSRRLARERLEAADSKS